MTACHCVHVHIWFSNMYMSVLPPFCLAVCAVCDVHTEVRDQSAIVPLAGLEFTQARLTVSEPHRCACLCFSRAGIANTKHRWIHRYTEVRG